MTLIMILAVLILVFSGLTAWGHYTDGDFRFIGGICLVIVLALAELFAILSFIPSKKDSEIRYKQLVQERISIVQMLENDRDVDRIVLNKAVIDYNNRVIAEIENSRRFIFRDYYSEGVDWESLEIVEWK